MSGEGREVRISIPAEQDLRAIYRRRLALRGADGTDGAEVLLAEILGVLDRLATFSERGPVPPELDLLGIRSFRQVTIRTYRAIYHAGPEAVTVLIVADARQDFRRLLEERLLRVR